MKSSKWRYKDYYERHQEQERKRTNAYYHEHRDEILAKRKEKYRQNNPKKVKLTPVDYKTMWRDLKEYMEDNGFVGVYEFMVKLEKTQLIFKEYYKQEMLKDVEN